VFFHTAGPVDGQVRDWGHVGIALGDGRLVHAWPEVRLDAIGAVPMLPSGDWSSPRYAGWAGPSTILAGARPAQPPTASPRDRRPAQDR
jgi:cell wall-associated NlpC family hydrolase